MTLKQSEPKVFCHLKDVGLIDYASGYRLQQQVLREVIEGNPSVLILCEHNPVFTLGRMGAENNILLSQDEIKRNGIEILRIDRGGEVTFHGPGQLVIYPIFRLEDFGKDLKLYMGQLEQVAIDLLRHFDIVANRISGQRGVWVKDKKIASIGIGVKKWVSFHGIAININTDLRFFSMIKPCGLDVQMTTLRDLKGKKADMHIIKEKIIQCFQENFSLDFLEGEIR